MDVSDLVLRFSGEVEVPIDPNDVKKFILSEGRDLTIRFIGVDLNTEVLRGHLAQYVKTACLYGEETNIADVYYDTEQGSDWIRLVCIKELTHILDPQDFKTYTGEDLRTLVKRMALSPEFESLTVEKREGGPKVMVDKLAVIYAVAIAFPWAVRTLVLPKIADETLNETDVARLVNLPLRYVRLVLSDYWPTVHEALT